MSRFMPSIVRAESSRRGVNLIVLLWTVGIIAVVVSMYRDWLSPLVNRDFVSVWVAGRMATAGHAAQVFDVELLRDTAKKMTGNGLRIGYPYPPHALFIAIPLSRLPYVVAFWTWQSISALLFYVAARPYLPKSFSPGLAVVTPAALISVIYGQVGLFFGALWLFAFSGSSAATAVLTFKPHLGFLAGVEAIRSGRLLRTSAAAAIILAMSVVAFGLDTWRAWLNGAAAGILGDLSHAPYGIWYFQMTTPYLGYGLVGWGLFAVGSILLLVRSFNVFTAATAAFLIAPYGFHYDMTVVSLGFGLLLFERLGQLLAWETFVCALAFLAPVLVQLGTWVVPPLLLTGLYVQTRRFGDCEHPEQS
jgi:hypothetical protein